MGKALDVWGKTKRDIKNAVCLSLRQGANIVKACADAGISRSAYYDWMENDVHFRQAVGYALKSRVGIVADAVYEAAVKGDVAAQKFFLTNRDPDNWKDRGTLVNNGIMQGEGGRAIMPVQINVIGVKPDAKPIDGHRDAAEGGGMPMDEGQTI